MAVWFYFKTVKNFIFSTLENGRSRLHIWVSVLYPEHVSQHEILLILNMSLQVETQCVCTCKDSLPALNYLKFLWEERKEGIHISAFVESKNIAMQITPV